MVSHNSIPKNHFHKDWARWVRQNFNQVFKKAKRNRLREQKSRRLAPNPVQQLKPIVRCPSSRYNSKQRLGRGFSLAEIRAVGLCAKEARSIGIKVDHRRRNKSVEGFAINKQRLKEYRNKLVLFPKGKIKLAVAESVKEYTQCVNERPTSTKSLKSKRITKDEKEFSAFITLRQARGAVKKQSNQRKKAAKKQLGDIK